MSQPRLSGLFHKAHNLKQAVGILFVTVLISNVLGLIRNIVIANRVGVTYGSIGPLDTYYAAFVLPDFLYSILIVGALSSAILPLLVQLDSEGDEKQFWRTFNVLLSTGFTVVVFGLLVLYVVLPYLVPALFPGFSSDEHARTITLTQVMLLSPLFFTVSQLSTSALQARRMFFAPALAPIVYNLAIISGALLIPQFGLPVLVFGVILGAASHFLVQLPTLLRLGWRFNFELGVKNPYVARVLKLMIPRTIALTSMQLLLIVFYRLASRFSEGSIAIYRLTDDLQTAPVLLLANTLAMAILPDFARHFAREQHEEFESLVSKAIRFLLYIFLPTTLFLLIFSDQIIGLYISIGHSINPFETATAIKTFRFFTISLFFQGTVLLLARAYFARSNTFKPTLYSVISLVIALAAAQFFTHVLSLGVAGLALAFSIGSIVNAVLLWANLGISWRQIFYDGDKRLNLPLVLLGGLITGLVFLLVHEVDTLKDVRLFGSPSVQNLFVIVSGLVLGGAFYGIWSKTFKLEQWRMIRPQSAGSTSK